MRRGRLSSFLGAGLVAAGLIGLLGHGVAAGSADSVAGAGTLLSGSCQGGQTIGVELDHELAGGGFQVVGVHLSGLLEDCVGWLYEVAIDAGDTRPAATGLVDGAEVAVAIEGVPAGEVSSVSVVLTGP